MGGGGVTVLIIFRGGGGKYIRERTNAQWDNTPLGQKSTGRYPTGKKLTAKFGKVDKSPLLQNENRFKSVIKLLILIRLLLQGKSHLQCYFSCML